jgi:5-methylcytosine-specific restriction endonuclease McrA
MGNPRYANGAKRRAIRQWVLSTQDICGICGQPVDKTLKTPHPMSPEVDEIIPISKGGSPYERSNVQLAHRICNQRKGNKMPGRKLKGASNTQQEVKFSQEW